MSENIEVDVCIIGAGPSGLFAGFEAGLHKLSFVIVDALDSVGGQCSALYPEKPIYDIPALPAINAGEMIKNLEQQLAPFKPQILLNQTVDDIQPQTEDQFKITTSQNNTIISKAIIIAAGVGAFGPNRPPLDNLNQFEENGDVQYFIKNKNLFKNKKVTIAGGGDSALDWAVLLAEEEIAQLPVQLVHRRNKFRAAPATLEKMSKLEKEHKIQKITPYQLSKLIADNGKLAQIELKTLTNETKTIHSDYLLAFYGLSQNLGSILNWNLEIENKLIKVKPNSQQTNVKGIYAIGDICNYDGKLKLILSGFSEAARAIRSIEVSIYPDRIYDNSHSSDIGIPSI